MKLFKIPALLLCVVVFFSSCQKEIDANLLTENEDTTAVEISSFRIVQIDMVNVPNDSIIRIVKTFMNSSNQRSVLVAELYPPAIDTIFRLFTYNGQNLVNIKETISSLPSVVYANYKFTWTGGKLVKMVCDTAGVFESSIDFIYTPAGANTEVTTVETPSRDVVLPDYFSRVKNRLTVNGQFVPVQQRFASHTYIFQGGLPENYHDTANFYYNYNAGDLSSANAYASRHDTTGPGGSITNIGRDTLDYIYNRNNNGVNISDSLRKIYGNEIYTFMNFEIIPRFSMPILFTGSEFEYVFFKKPMNDYAVSKKTWYNGVFDASQSYSNLQVRKLSHSFDAQQRLTRSDIFQEFSTTFVREVLKVYY